MIPMYWYDYMGCMDNMGPDVRCLKKAGKLNSLGPSDAYMRL